MRTFLKLTPTKLLLVIALMSMVVSCKSTKVVSNGTVSSKLSSKAVIKAHYQNETRFKTLNGKIKIGYSDGESAKNVTVSLRMEKDKAIWMSAPFNVVKVYITPDRVSFYNKLENQYFDGDFSYLSNLLGTEVDFSILQNLLLGQAIVDLRSDKYMLTATPQEYELRPKTSLALYKMLFSIEPKNYKMAMQQISQPQEHRVLTIGYQNYQSVGTEIFPNEISVQAVSKEATSDIRLAYKNIELNQQLSFPYKIPSGYTKIEL